MMIVKSMYMYIVLIIVFGLSCREKPTDQTIEEHDKNINYRWTVDTLFFTNGTATGQTLINDIYGFNDSTVYAVGHDAWNGVGALWLFDGDKWMRKKIFKYEGGFAEQALHLETIYGFDSNNIFLGGAEMFNHPSPPPDFIDSGIVWQYQNSLWKKIKLGTATPVNTMYGKSASDIYFSNGNLLFHYNGEIITTDTIPLFFNGFSVKKLDINYAFISNTDELFTASTVTDDIGRLYFQLSKKSNNEWALTDSFTLTNDPNNAKWGNHFLWISNNGSIYSCGFGGVYKFVASSWDKIFSSSFISDIYGAEEKHLYAVSITNDVYFFNGSSWKKIFNPNNINYSFGRIWCTKNQVFVSFQDGTKSYVYRGVIFYN